MTDAMTDGDWQSVKDAAALLGVSERTIWRRVKAGRLSIDRSVTPHLVDVSDAMTDASEQTSERESEPVASVSELRAEVRRLSDLLEEVRSQRDYLEKALAASLSTSQRLLEHVEEPFEDAEREETVGVLARFGRWLSGGQ